MNTENRSNPIDLQLDTFFPSQFDARGFMYEAWHMAYVRLRSQSSGYGKGLGSIGVTIDVPSHDLTLVR